MSVARTAIGSLRDIRPHLTLAEAATMFMVFLLLVLGPVFVGEARSAPARSHDKPVPILMYHVIAAPPAGVPFPDLFVRPKDFTAEMEWLARKRFQSTSGKDSSAPSMLRRARSNTERAPTRLPVDW